ncbi:MAG: phosphopantetheine-binding protein [Sulfitobacter sp.]
MNANFPLVVTAINAVLEFQSGTELTPTTRLEADLGMDSGLMLELIMELEERVPNLVIDQAEISYEQFKTIDTICTYIDENVKVEELA